MSLSPRHEGLASEGGTFDFCPAQRWCTLSTDGEGPLEQRRTSGGKPATGGNGRWPWGAPDSQHPTRTPRAENSPRLGLTCRAGGVLRPLRRFLRWSSAAPAVPRRFGKGAIWSETN